jgi:hypothetical protein
MLEFENSAALTNFQIDPSTIEITPSHVSRFFGYFAALSLVMLPAVVAFARKKPRAGFFLAWGSYCS